MTIQASSNLFLAICGISKEVTLGLRLAKRMDLEQLPQQDLASDTRNLIIIYFIRQVINVKNADNGIRIRKSKFYRLFYPFFCVTLLGVLCSIVQSIVSNDDAEAILHPAFEGKPNVFVSARTYASGISRPRIGDNRLYLHYSDLDMVQVFDLTGMYLFTINFADNAHNSGSDCYAAKDTLYYRERKYGHLYTFCDTLLVDELNGRDAIELERKIRQQNDIYKSSIDADQNIYWIQGADIVRTLPDGAVETVVDRNDIYMFFQMEWLNSLYVICNILLVPSFLLVLFSPPVMAKLAHRNRTMKTQPEKIII